MAKPNYSYEKHQKDMAKKKKKAEKLQRKNERGDTPDSNAEEDFGPPINMPQPEPETEKSE